MSYVGLGLHVNHSLCAYSSHTGVYCCSQYAPACMIQVFINNVLLVARNSQQSYQQLLVNIRTILQAKYSQKPQLSSSHPMVGTHIQHSPPSTDQIYIHHHRIRTSNLSVDFWFPIVCIQSYTGQWDS